MIFIKNDEKSVRAFFFIFAKQSLRLALSAPTTQKLTYPLACHLLLLIE